jgi:hypothetical protein
MKAKEESLTSDIWSILGDRERDMLYRRNDGQSLATIGALHSVTRERARQILAKTDKDCAALADLQDGSWRERVRERLGAMPAIADEDIEVDIPDPSGAVRSALLRAMGLCHPNSWAGQLKGLWTYEDRKKALDKRLRQLAAQAPYLADELRERARALDIPDATPLEMIMTHARSPLTRGGDSAWLRRSALTRDAAYLWLSEQGEPRRLSEIHEAVGATSEGALRERLRCDDRFIMIRTERTWALAEWPLSRGSRHANALEAILEVLTERGPLSREALFAEARQRYPVTAARLSQCMISDRIGLTASGLIDLAERGAAPMEEREPRCPDYMAVDESGQVLGVRLSVDKEILRGSGVIVHTWLTWYLGLRLAPMSKSFTFDNGEQLTVRRNTSAGQLTSLRHRVVSMGMGFGCRFVILLRLDTSTVALRHTCDQWGCPARSAPDVESAQPVEGER